MLRLNRYTRPYWGYMLLTMFIKFVGTAMELLIPYLMEIMLDVKVPEGNLSGIYVYGGLMLLSAGACLAGNIVANKMSAVSSGRITKAVRHDLFDKLQHLSARQLDELTVPSAESRLTSDTYNVNQLLARVQRMGIRAPILLIGGAAMMLSMDAVLALVLLGLLPIIAVAVYLVTKKSVPVYTSQQGVLDKVVRVVQENITGIRIIKALSKTEHEKQRFHTINEALTALDRKAGILTAITNPVASLTLNLGLTLVVVVGAYRVNSGEILSGVIVAFLQYFVMLLNAMLGITRIFVLWSKGEASANRVADVLALPEDLAVQAAAEEQANAAVRQDVCAQPTETVPHAAAAQLEKTVQCASDRTAACASALTCKQTAASTALALPSEQTLVPHIEFRHVNFSYTGIGKNIDDLSFTLQRGQTLGILGSTGSGKSTLLYLLLRFYDPDSGAVLIDGQDIRTIAYDTLRQKFGAVFQNDFVAEGTIGDNIRFFRALEDEALSRAAQAAQADFIAEKGGLDAPVLVRGNNLSGGQKQRVLIARALAATPEILLLDDASSALDYETDANLRRALRKQAKDTTTILVAQRVSSVQHADLILVLSDGAVLGAGTHEQLLQSCEEYKLIARTQMGDGKEAG